MPILSSFISAVFLLDFHVLLVRCVFFCAKELHGMLQVMTHLISLSKLAAKHHDFTCQEDKDKHFVKQVCSPQGRETQLRRNLVVKPPI